MKPEESIPFSENAQEAAKEHLPPGSRVMLIWVDKDNEWHGRWSIGQNWPEILQLAAQRVVTRARELRYGEFVVPEEKFSDVRVADVYERYQSLQDWEKHQFRKLLELEDEAGQTAAVCGSQPTETGDPDVQEPPR